MVEAITELLGREPFAPFQIVMTSGDRFRIENPNLAVVGASLLTYFFPRSNGFVQLRLNQTAVLLVDESNA